MIWQIVTPIVHLRCSSSGERVLNCTEYTPVDMKIIEDDFKTGAMDTAITLDGEWRKCQPVLKSLAPILV